MGKLVELFARRNYDDHIMYDVYSITTGNCVKSQVSRTNGLVDFYINDKQIRLTNREYS